MLKCWQIKRKLVLLLSVCFISMLMTAAYAEKIETAEEIDIDRLQLVTQQIDLLKDRLNQGQTELKKLQAERIENIPTLTIQKAGKNLHDKATLAITVTQSSLDGINIELTDSQQTIAWLQKNTQEIEKQLNVMSIFGIKFARSEIADIRELQSDLKYQMQLLEKEKLRMKYLQQLQTISKQLLSFKKDKLNRLNLILKSRQLLHLKQQQMKDELSFQREQNQWLQELNVLNARLANVDPIKSKTEYALLERDIFYTNENANFAYTQSLIARYSDQLQQMKVAITKGDSIGVLNDISDQVLVLYKQVTRLREVIHSRIALLNKHVVSMSQRKTKDEQIKNYVNRLSSLENRYKISNEFLAKLSKELIGFRLTVDKALQVELSSRQGLPTFDVKMLIDLGKEMLLIPALAFQATKSLSSYFYKGVQSATGLKWSLFFLAEIIWLMTFLHLRKFLSVVASQPSKWRDQINSKWISIQCLKRNLLDLALIANIVGTLLFFDVPLKQFTFIVYFSMVWLIFKSIITIAKVCLVETTHDSGHDMRLYSRLKWFILAGAVITTGTVFVHQLPLVYEIKAFADQVFLLLMMMVSILLLRSWDVVPNLILSDAQLRHPYFHRSVKLIWILIPVLMFTNAAIGLFGFVNLIMTVSWYEGVFLLVLIGYLVFRGLISDGMELLSRLMIQYVHNGWLWTEAFLKPLDKILRISLFFAAWAVLFLFFGWDQQSPVVLRLTRMLHYQFNFIPNSTITPLNIIKLFVMISVFYWSAKWVREFVYRFLLSRTSDLGLRNSIAILSQYFVVFLGIFICLRILGINLQALAVVASMFALGVGLGLRDLVNNFACGFLILLERPLRVGDIVNINGTEGEVLNIGSRAITVRTWDRMELVVPNAEIFNKTFTNWTAHDDVVRCVHHIKIGRFDNPYEVCKIIYQVLGLQKDILKEPAPEVFVSDMSDIFMEFELRFFVNIRQVKSRISVGSNALMKIWDEFDKKGIKPPYPQQEIFIRGESAAVPALEVKDALSS